MVATIGILAVSVPETNMAMIRGDVVVVGEKETDEMCFLYEFAYKSNS